MSLKGFHVIIFIESTQCEYFKSPSSKPSSQDIQILGEEESTYVEFQNLAYPSKPIKVRYKEYLALGLSHNKKKLANQIWILANDVEELLEGNNFALQTLVNKVTGNDAPDSSTIIFISLTGLSKASNTAGQLAKMLLGMNYNFDEPRVLSIKDSYSKEFGDFRDDKEANFIMSVQDRWLEQGVDIGIEKGRAEGIDLGIEKGRAEGIGLGLEEGLTQKAISVARKMLLKNKPIEEISELTDLDEATIRGIII